MQSSDIAVSERTSLATVMCFLRSEDSPYVLGTKPLSDVGTYFTGLEKPRFSVEPCFMLYPSHYELAPTKGDGLCFFRILMTAAPTVCLTVYLPCLAHGEGTAFPRSAYITS